MREGCQRVTLAPLAGGLLPLAVGLVLKKRCPSESTTGAEKGWVFPPAPSFAR